VTEFFDPVRRKNLKALPEEKVRQALVRWLASEVGVPASLTGVEYPLSSLVPGSRKRADVVAWRPGGTGLAPWLLAECKAPSVRLGESVADQVRGYAAAIRAEHALITNGAETRCFRLEGGRYVEAAGLPAFPGRKED
jgi:hypothetical protein